MEFVKISKGRGNKYACNNQLYSRYATKKDVTYLKCDVSDCKGCAKIADGANELTVTHEHNDHMTQETEIQKLILLSRCRKRAADDLVLPLRQIYETESRNDMQVDLR